MVSKKILFHLLSTTSIYRLNRKHERAFETISEDYTSSFSDLVTLLNEKTIRHINFLMIEVLKYLNELSPDFMNEVFRFNVKPSQP